MKKKVVSILVIILFFASIFGTVNADKTCDCKESNESNTNINTQSTKISKTLGRGFIMGNGMQSESYVDPKCYDVGDIVCFKGEMVEYKIEYKIDCWGLWDWGQVTAKVNGIEKPAAETQGNIEGDFTWEIPRSGDRVNWEITCKLRDDGGNWEKIDYCSGSSKLRDPKPDLDLVKYEGDYIGNAEELVYRKYEIKNIGEPRSILNWEITRKDGEFFSTYSNWAFSPGSESGSLEEDRTRIIKLDWIIPRNLQWDGETTGEFRIQNKDNNGDFEIAPVYFRNPLLEDLKIYDEDDSKDHKLTGGKHYVKVHWKAKDESVFNSDPAVRFFWKENILGLKHYEPGKKDFYENDHYFEAYLLYEGKGSSVILGAETPDGRELTKVFTYRVSVQYPKFIEKDFTVIKILYEKFPLIAQLIAHVL